MEADKPKLTEKQLKEQADAKRKQQEEEEMRRKRADPNFNPLLQNSITNKDVSFILFLNYLQIFRTLLFHFKTDNYLPVEKVTEFVADLLKRPIVDEHDDAAERRFRKSLNENLSQFAKDGKIYEKQFCELMRTFEVSNSMEYSDEKQYDIFLERLFYRINHKKQEQVNVADFRNLIERSGFKFQDDEFESLVKWYFRGKETITLDDFKLFATGQMIKNTDSKKK